MRLSGELEKGLASQLVRTGDVRCEASIRDWARNNGMKSRAQLGSECPQDHAVPPFVEFVR
jgi:hypothetical protein